MSDGRLWYKADEAIAEAERILSAGAGVLVDRVHDAAQSLSSLHESDVPGWIWELVQRTVKVGTSEAHHEVSARSFVDMLRDLRVKLDGELDEGSSFLLCPQCRMPMVPGEVTLRRGIVGRLGGGDGLTIRFTPADEKEKQILIEPVDPVAAHVCAICDGVFLARAFDE